MFAVKFSNTIIRIYTIIVLVIQLIKRINNFCNTRLNNSIIYFIKLENKIIIRIQILELIIFVVLLVLFVIA